MYILSSANTADANAYYRVSWGLYPDMAMDLVVPLLGRFIAVEPAARIFFLTSQLLVIAGAVALELSVKRHHQLAGLAALLTLHSLPFSLGLVNFEFGTGIALLGIASWIALSRSAKLRVRYAAHIAFSSILFLSHFFALGIYGLTIGLLELRRALISKSDARCTLITVVTLASPVVLMLFLMERTGATLGQNSNEWRMLWKPVWLLLFLNGYNMGLAAASFAALSVVLIYTILKQSLSVSIDGRWIGVGFLIVFIALPFKLCGSNMADIRMVTATLLIMPAFVALSPRTRSLGYLVTAVISAIILVNSVYANYIWSSYRSDYEAIKRSFALLRGSSFVLVGNDVEVTSSLLSDVPMWRAPTLAVHYAEAFVSSLYTVSGTHAVQVRPDLKRLEVDNKVESYAPPSLETLELIARGEKVASAPRYLRDWTHDFDYLYLLGSHNPGVLPDLLDELVTERRFTLYRIRK
jgi:hypothetical protein